MNRSHHKYTKSSVQLLDFILQNRVAPDIIPISTKTVITVGRFSSTAILSIILFYRLISEIPARVCKILFYTGCFAG